MWTATSVKFQYRLGGPASAWYAFFVPDLSDAISGVTFKRKASRVTVVLTKAAEFSWFDLAKKK
jgi:hypothetical protein